MFPILQILLLGGVAHNTAVTAANANKPEFVKQADWLAQGFYQQIRRKSRAVRFIWNLGATTISIILLVGWCSGENLGFIFAGWIIGWYVINSFFKNSAMQKAYAQAWSIIDEKNDREAIIQEAMYQAATSRLQLQ